MGERRLRRRRLPMVLASELLADAADLKAGWQVLDEEFARWAMRCKPIINAFAITFGDRFPPPRPTNNDRRNTVPGRTLPITVLDGC